MSGYSNFCLQAVEQIRLAEEERITKEKIKEVEEEWQNNLLNWKSKRRQSRQSDNSEIDVIDDNHNNSGRKIRTFSEILNERAKCGGRIGYNLLDYVKDFEANEANVLTSKKCFPSMNDANSG